MNTNTLFMLLLLSGSFMSVPMVLAADDHNNNSKESTAAESHDEKGVVVLTPEQMQAADVVVKPLQAVTLNSVIEASGEVKFNSYETTSITPRIAAQVIGSHVKLGETVRVGQPVITLSSVEMAEAQGLLLVTDREWGRVKKLGREVVSESRYTEAKVNRELAKAKVMAYGMTEKQVNELLSSKDYSLANGRFELVSNHAGTVLNENYIQGQLVESGHELIRITNEASMWVVVNVPPSVANQITVGNKASVQFNSQVLPAKVIQMYHSLDEVTRTTGVRLEVKNPDDLLHPGMFVSATLEISAQSDALVLPEAAVLRSPDGDWQVLVEQDKPGEFKGVEVELVRVTEGMAVIAGLNVGTRVVTQGAFFVQSELAKSGFDIHNH